MTEDADGEDLKWELQQEKYILVFEGVFAGLMALIGVSPTIFLSAVLATYLAAETFSSRIQYDMKKSRLARQQNQQKSQSEMSGENTLE